MLSLPLALAWLCAAAQPPASGGASPPAPPAPSARPAGPAKPIAPAPAIASRLRRGVNLSHWWWKPSAMDDSRPGRLITQDDVAALKAAGVTHVRIPVDPALVLDSAERLNQAAMAALTAAVTRVEQAGLAVVIAVNLAGSSASRMTMEKNPEGWERELTAFWGVFAVAWRSHPTASLAVELCSEPNGRGDDQDWSQAQERLRTVVRRALPNHTLILSGDDWGSIDGLLRLKPSADRNAVYTFHFYEPHAFTHQQAAWGSPMWKEIKNLRYPFDRANADAALAATADPKARSAISRYTAEKWNAAAIRARFDKVSEWARSNGATVYLGEFGAYRAGCDPASRAEWLKDVRVAAEGAGFGWCAWDYAGGYAITDRKGETRSLDEEAARALGLTVPQGQRRRSPSSR